jgi:cyclopropane-fatty-acyl-phospholipid synthase
MLTRTSIKSDRISNLSIRSLKQTPKPYHRFFKALRRISHGQIIIKTPEGSFVCFKGEQSGPEAHMDVHKWSAFDALIQRGEIGFAESYMNGEWDSKDLPNLIMFGLANTDSLERYFYGRPWYALWLRFCDLWNQNTLTGSQRNIAKHYDLGNDFYELWLDKSMTYSCALFNGNHSMSLEEAQAAKYRRILSKLALEPGAHIVDIGCGWGGFLEFAAREGMHVTGITISQTQKAYAEDRIRRQGLDHLARVELKDYRQIGGQFDGLVSIGMFEHVGELYWPVYFETVKSLLKPGGSAMIQSITIDENVFARSHHKRGFVEELIFPGGCAPPREAFLQQARLAGLSCHDVFSFGKDYAHTLKRWLQRFESKRAQVRALGYDHAFIRLWRFYLASCIASFTIERNNVMQVLLHSGDF